MSRHRDVRCMNYSDEYDGYDDVYGHSVEDDYCVSPSAEQFLFDRSKQQNIASFITEPDIVEDNEDVDEPSPSSNEEKFDLSELERAKLISCMETIRNVIGDTVSESKLRETIIQSNFNAEVALDTILKESSPKNITDTSINKERLERHPDVSLDKPNKSMFTIPRFSFNKTRMSLKDSSSISHPNNINNFEDIQQSPNTFSLLAEIVSSHAKSVSPDAKKLTSSTTNAPTFSSLAALTAHHLQNSNSAHSINLFDKQQSSSSQFVIPKFSIKKDNSDETESVQFLKSRDNETSTRLLIPQTQVTTNASDKNSIDSLRKDFSNMHILLRNNILADVRSDKQLENSLNVNNVHVASSDNCVVDLSTALKEVKLLADNDFNNKNSTISKKFYDMPNLEYIEDNGAMLNVLPVTLNLHALKYARLPYAKTTVSVFGRTLCKQWKTKKPVLKVIEHRYHQIIPFDFSIPYRSTK